MSKKVLIDKQALIDKLMKIPGIGSNSDALKTIKRFPSYEPQKVKVPAFVAKWIELCKEKADAASCLNGYYEIGNGTIVRPRGFSEEFYDWLADCDHMDALARAWLDGYEVEEESKWVVKIEDNGSAYFVDFFDELQPHLVYGLSGEVMRFDSEDKANAIVTLIECGTVEQVEV